MVVHILLLWPLNTLSFVIALICQEGTVHIIYGFLDKPLASLEKLNLSEIRTGVQRVLMLRPDTPPPTLPPDVQMLDVVAPNVIIPNQETTYWCYIHNLPENLPKNHIVMVKKKGKKASKNRNIQRRVFLHAADGVFQMIVHRQPLFSMFTS